MTNVPMFFHFLHGSSSSYHPSPFLVLCSQNFFFFLGWAVVVCCVVLFFIFIYRMNDKTLYDDNGYVQDIDDDDATPPQFGDYDHWRAGLVLMFIAFMLSFIACMARMYARATQKKMKKGKRKFFFLIPPPPLFFVNTSGMLRWRRASGRF